MRKSICLLVIIISILAAGSFADTAIRDGTPLHIMLIQFGACAAAMVGALIAGRLWESDEEEDNRHEATQDPKDKHDRIMVAIDTEIKRRREVNEDKAFHDKISQLTARLRYEQDDKEEK